jgi:hypothetical protein
VTPRTRPLLAAAFLTIGLTGCDFSPVATASPSPPSIPPKICGQAPDLAKTKGSAGAYSLTGLEIHPIAASAPPALVVSLVATKSGAISGSSYRIFLVRDGKVVAAGPLDPATGDGEFAKLSPREVTLTKGQPVQDIVREPLSLCNGETWPGLYGQHDQISVILITPVPAPKGAAPSGHSLIISAALPSAG